VPLFSASSSSRILTLPQCMEVSGSLLATIGAAPATPSFELGQRWLGQVSLMLDDPLTGGEDKCISCIMEIIRTERGLEVLKPLWPKVAVSLGARIASTNDVARAAAINALTQWISSAFRFCFCLETCKSTHTFYASWCRVFSRAGPSCPCARPADASAH
jgi:hypothetical protein